MLPDFRVPIELEAGQRRSLLVRDVPTCVFWQGFPAVSASMATAVTGLDRWLDALLIRITVRPRLSAAVVSRMGGARDRPLSAYLAGIGYAERSIPDPVSADALLEVDEGAEPIAGDPALRAFESWIPNAELRELLNALSKGSPLMPSDLWRLPISEFLFNLRVRLGNELLTATLPRLRRMTAERPQGPGKVLPFRPPTLRVIDVRDPLAAIGIERG